MKVIEVICQTPLQGAIARRHCKDIEDLYIILIPSMLINKLTALYGKVWVVSAASKVVCKCGCIWFLLCREHHHYLTSWINEDSCIIEHV